MILYIVRHGHPDYETDTLLPDGVEQAKRVAKRLAESGVDAVFSSPMGRARETAAQTADLLGLPVTACEWARELSRESETTYPDGVSKILSLVPNTYWTAPENRTVSLEDSFSKIKALRLTRYRERYGEISRGIDGLLGSFGYERTEEGFYRVTEPNEKHVALFCHAGMGRVIVSHLLNIPPQFTVGLLMPAFCAMTVFSFPKDAVPGEKAVPYLHAYGDYGHLIGEGTGGFPDGKTHQRI